MTFDLTIWKNSAAEKLRGIGHWLDRRRTQDAPTLVYGTLCGLSLWPLVEAAQAGQFLPVMVALGNVAGGVGGNLIAEQLQRWKDQADKVNEAQVTQWVAENASNADVRDALDVILAKLDAVPQAQAGLIHADQQWFTQTLRGELNRLGNLPHFEAALIGSGAIAQGAGAKSAGAGGVVAETIQGSVTTTYIEKQEVHQAAPPSPADQARTQYLKRLRQRCNVLPLAALGGEEDTGEEVSLDRVYVALDTRTEIPVSDQERAKRGASRPGRENRPLSAMEAATQATRLVLLGDAGGGKSTFVRQLTAMLAAACLGEREALPGWDTCLLPMLTTLRDLAPRLAGLTLEGISEDEQNRRLVQAVRQQWQADLLECGATDLMGELDKVLTDGTVVLVFDGLDEVATGVRARVRQAVRAVLREYPAIQRVMVTSRIRSYAGAVVLKDFTVHTLAPFDESKIGQFVEAWYRAQAALDRMSKERAEGNAQDLKRAALSSDLRELASNPMLLTTMAIIHQREVGLPKERVRLYSLAVQVLISRWQKRKGIAVSDALARVLSDDLKMRASLERLGYEAHQLQGAQGPEADLSRKDILALLEESQYLGEVGLASEFLDYCDQRAGLLVGRGGDEEGRKPQTYNFPHRTFQEYLAGCYMVAGRGVDREYWRRAESGDTWYLAARLGAEELLYNRRNAQILLDLAYELCPAETPEKEAAWRAALWSGQMAALLGQAEVKRDTEKPGGGPAYLNRLLPRLVQIVETNELGAIERAEAGRALGKLGDPRPEVMTLEGMQFCFVPHGPFWLGSDEPESQTIFPEGPVHQLNLPDYWMACYPVTNAQFAEFVQAGGYSESRYWREAQAANVWRDGQVHLTWADEIRCQPADFGEPFNLPNHPVVGVTWYEALAFTRWLTERWRALLLPGWSVRLPSEAEWEKSARGGEQIAHIKSQISDVKKAEMRVKLDKNPVPKRRYPWGDAPDANHANYGDTHIGTTNAVGCFAGGASPYGCEEMSGNVWEWTSSIYQHYPYNPKDGRELLKSTDARVLRGGAFYGSGSGVRCAFRSALRGSPDSRDWYWGFRVVLSPL